MGNLESGAPREFDRSLMPPNTCDHVAAQRGIGAIGEEDAIVFHVLGAIHGVAWTAIKVVSGDDDVGAVFDDEIALEALPKRVAADGDAARVTELDVHLHIAEDIPGDGDIAFASRFFARAFFQRLIRATT